MQNKIEIFFRKNIIVATNPNPNPNPKQMGYHFMNIEQMKKLDLFDDIPYKYIKNIINNDEEAIDVVVDVEFN